MIEPSADAMTWVAGSYAALALGHLRRTPQLEPTSTVAATLIQRALAVAESCRAALVDDQVSSTTLSFQLDFFTPTAVPGFVDPAARRASAPSLSA